MTLSTFTIGELAVFTGSVLAGLGVLVSRTQQSRCRKCSVCYGCLNCERDVPSPLPVQQSSDEPEEGKETDKIEIVTRQ